MAGEWIKMRNDLADDPAVVAVASKLGIDEDTVVGKLHRLWAWADRHTTTGCAAGITFEWIDRFVRLENFAATLSEAGWLSQKNGIVSLPKFSRHNGKTAKQRALTAKRMAQKRVAQQRNKSDAHSVTHASPREEKNKRREEKNTEDTNTNPGAPPDGTAIDPKTDAAAARTDQGGVDQVEIPGPLSTADFQAAWFDWLAYRRERRIKTTHRTMKAQLEMLSRAGPADAVAMIRRSITNGWNGLFELDGRNANRKPNAGHFYDPRAVGDI